jgi:competence protein ComEC
VPLSLSGTGLIAAYLIIFSLTWLAWIGRDRRHDLLLRLSQNMTARLAIAGSAVVAILAISWTANQPDGRLHISFFDVGQGDATFIQTPSGRQILIDGGAYPTLLHDHLGREIPFWDRDIDLVIATHSDTDHIAGLPGVFDRYQVTQLITNGQESEEASFKALDAAAAEQNTSIHKTIAGEVISIGDGVRLEILSPSAQQLLASGSQHDNDSSVCLRLVYKDFSLLLTGDVSQKVEGELVQSGRPLSALLYKAGHHGSKSSNSRNFLEAVRPEYVVISSGEENRYGHPHEEVLRRVSDVGAAVLRTDELGTIEVVTDGQAMWWEANDE